MPAYSPVPSPKSGPVRDRNLQTVEHRPSLALNVRNEGNDGRRPSVQFAPHGSKAGNPKQVTANVQRRMSSPPPPPSFKPRVSFDTFDNHDASDFSLTLNRKHKNYEYTKRSRTFLCGTDTNDYSEFALEWLIDELVDDRDEIVCLRVVEKDSKFTGDASIQAGRYKAEAERMMQNIQSKNTDDRAINLVLEFSVGKVHDTIQKMIRIYEPAILVVGTRGRSLGGFQGLLPGSVSKYCLQSSPVPVAVVRPSSKRDKKKQKRLQDPSRRGYKDILDKTDLEGGHFLSSSSIVTDTMPAAADEEQAVLDAIRSAAGNNSGFSALTKVQSNRSDISQSSLGSAYSRRDSDSVRSPTDRLLKSPELRDLESPAVSGDEYESDEEEDVEAVPTPILLAQEKAAKAGRELEAEVANDRMGKAGDENTSAKPQHTLEQLMGKSAESARRRSLSATREEVRPRSPSVGVPQPGAAAGVRTGSSALGALDALEAKDEVKLKKTGKK
ncbi:hypothetical protein BJ546DRAFT_973789 [Cryomyces antarcticus]